MKYAILADIHANLEALTACLAHADRQGAATYAFLGDLVGYGADPRACLAIIQDHVAAGALLVRGNHDEAALGGLCLDMNPAAREAALWTRAVLCAAERDFLAGLPYTVVRDTILFVHASADSPPDWDYVSDERAARRCLAATSASLIFAGHVHHPLLFHSVREPDREGVVAFAPQTGVPLTLTVGRRWLALAGAVGQPRDGNPAAAYLLYDTASRQLTLQRVPYDWMTAAAKIRAAGLPEVLARRLGEGW